MNQLILGDNLEIMKKMDSESIDLIYLDPPFFSNRNYEVIWGDKGEIRSFEDRWSGGIDHYIAWLKERVQEMHRLLKPTGSLYLHCDWHADAYIRVYILDKIFGENNFINEIIWCYATPSGSNKRFGRKHDSIFVYSKSKDYTFNVQRIPHASGLHNTGQMWKKKDKGSNTSLVKQLEEQGKKLEDWWTDIYTVDRVRKEMIGYPTQKPQALLNRIILASSNENDLILDPFVGGGTTIAVADILNRKWIGIDQSVQAIKVSELRLNKQQSLFSAPFTVSLHKYDYDTLRYKDAFEFEKFIVEQYGGKPNIKQKGDLGIDGKAHDGSPIQVKRSDNIGRNVIDNFKSAAQRYDNYLFDNNIKEGKSIGTIIAFTFGKGAVQEVARLKNEQGIIIDLVKVEEIIPIAKRPKVSLRAEDLGTDNKGLREIEFIAVGESEAGIEFFSWDFDYNNSKFIAKVVLDKEGKQSQKFKPGNYVIAVKVIDNEGLEEIQTIKLKINGEVTQE